MVNNVCELLYTAQDSSRAQFVGNLLDQFADFFLAQPVWATPALVQFTQENSTSLQDLQQRPEDTLV